jgi:uncharacterized protein
MDMERLQLSGHLEIVPRDGSFAVYHKLLGNLSLLDEQGMEFLRSFSEPRNVSEKIGKELHDRYVSELRDRYFLVPEGVDERHIVDDDKRFRENNLQSGYLLKGIQLVLTNDCNLGCSYCFQETIEHTTPVMKFKGISLSVKGESTSSPHLHHSSSKDGDDLRKMPPETAIETVRNAIRSVKDAGNRMLSIEFFGGEPLLNWKAIEAVLDTFGTESDGVRLFYSITTNATKVTDDIARKFRKNEVTVTVSFDSPKNVNRVTKRGASADSLIHKGLEILGRNDSILTFNSVISVDNVDDVDVEGLLAAAKEHNVRAIGLILDLAVKPYEDRIRMAKVVDTVMRICERAPEYGIPITGYWHQIFEQIIGEQMLNLQKGYKTCAAEGCKLSFEPDGTITSCKTSEKPIGHSSAIEDVFKTGWYKANAMKAYETTPFCRGCPIEGFCSGLCMGTLQKTFDNVNAIVPAACDVYRDLTKRLIQLVPDEGVEKLYLSEMH